MSPTSQSRLCQIRYVHPTVNFPCFLCRGNLFQNPPYFSYITKSFYFFKVIVLSNDSQYLIIDECFPYLSKQILTEKSNHIGIPRETLTPVFFTTTVSIRSSQDSETIRPRCWGIRSVITSRGYISSTA